MATTSTTYKFFTMLVVMNKWMLLAVSAFGSLPYGHGHGHGHEHGYSNHAPVKTAAFTGTASSYSSSSSSNSRRASQLLASSFKNTNANTIKKKKSRIAVRPRPLVKLDEAGIYIPPQRIREGQDTDSTSSNSSTSTSASISVSSPRGSSWDEFKDGIYNCVDFVTVNSKNTISNSITNRKMAVVYSGTVEAQIGNQNGSRRSKSKPIAIKPPASSPVRDYAEMEQNLLLQYQASLKTSPFIENKDISNGENLYQSDLRKSFDSGKDVIYGTIDSLTAKKGKKGNNNEGSAASLFPNTYEGFKVATKPSMNRDERVAILAEYASDLTSTNPIKRLKANLVIAADERRRKRRLERERREATVNGIKQILYDFVDSIQILYEVLVKLPSEVEKSVEATQYQIDRTVEELQRAPEKFQQVVQGTMKSVEETQKTTLKIVNEVQQVPKKVGGVVVGTVKEVQAIPTKVNNSISDTKRSIEETRKGVENFVQETKYRTGLEQRPPPPAKAPEELRKDLALKVAKEAAVFAGKASVVIAQSTAGMAVGGVKLALQAAKTAQEKSKKERKDGDMVRERRVVAPIARSSSPVTPMSIAEIDPMLEKEVAEALRLAEAAVNAPPVLQQAPKPLVESKPKPAIKVLRRPKPVAISPNDIDINEAVNRAKLAAQNAKRDAAELEDFLNKRRVAKK
mmetsp:Transcript_12147/g.18214  ORF Transcript_12147/g.18214 Transcript_12147/m.18214 type:complete len:684 (+) Transcript_12147:131-2182(+)